MREALRGALLSVLFFALLIGGAPSTVAADLHSASAAHTSPGACNTNGGTWVDSGSSGNPNGYCDYGSPGSTNSRPGWCEDAGKMLGYIGFEAGLVGGGAALVGGISKMAGWGAAMGGTMGPVGIGLLGLGAIGGVAWWYNCS